MRRCLCHLAAVLLLLFAFSSFAVAQPPRPGSPTDEKAEKLPPVVAYVVAFTSTLLVLWIICQPSRKV